METAVSRLKQFPVVAILGPRQCGKSTLARVIAQSLGGSVFLDLEKPSDRNKLEHDAESYLASQANKLICLDEIQRTPELFPVLRSFVDEGNRPGQVLILGSASRDLLHQSSETLAGRIAYLELTPLLLEEAGASRERALWLRGGFPRSFLAETDENSTLWRDEFIRTYIERDIPGLGISIPPESLRRFVLMCTHFHGQLWNHSKIAQAMDISHTTVRHYLDLMTQAFVTRILPAHSLSIKKRLVKAPKVYIRDTGLLHSLLGIMTQDELFGHPVYGASWESFAIENILAAAGPSWSPSFYRTSTGAEVDLVLSKGKRVRVFEFKSSSSPTLSRGFWNALEDLEPDDAWVVAPVPAAYPIGKKVQVVSLAEATRLFRGDRA